MDKEYIQDIVESEISEKTEEDLEIVLEEIESSLQSIDHLFKDAKTYPYLKDCVLEEMIFLLDVLPEEVKVLHFSKNCFVSRAQEEDKIITIWRREDVQNYEEELKKLFVSKRNTKQNRNFPYRWN